MGCEFWDLPWYSPPLQSFKGLPYFHMSIYHARFPSFACVPSLHWVLNQQSGFVSGSSLMALSCCSELSLADKPTVDEIVLKIHLLCILMRKPYGQLFKTVLASDQQGDICKYYSSSLYRLWIIMGPHTIFVCILVHGIDIIVCFICLFL